MKRFIWVLILIVAVFAAAPAPAAFAAECKTTPLDNMWDWVTTLGKEGLEKQKILAENKAERLKKCVERQAKKAQKEAEKAGGDMKKKLGL